MDSEFLKQKALQQIRHWGLWGEQFEFVERHGFESWVQLAHKSKALKDADVNEMRAAWNAAIREIKGL